VQASGMSIVYGRVRPPADAADANRLPAFLMVLGPDGPLGYASGVAIEETNRAESESPSQIAVRAESQSVNLSMTLDVGETAVTKPRPGAVGTGLDFIQMRASYHVSGQVSGKPVDFHAQGSAETFRGH